MYAAVVIAAGASVRLGSPKALARVGGQPAVTRICRLLNTCGIEDIAVVVGMHASRIQPEVPVPARVVENPRWAEGRSGSLQTGLRAVPPGAPFLFWPVDHPGVRLPTLRALLAAQGAIRVPTFNGKRGHPVLFEASLRDEILRLRPDQPLHDVVHAEPHRIREVAVDDPGVLLNVDTADDLKKLQGLLP